VLNVRKVNEFNLTLLKKWCWRHYVDLGGTWFKVMVTSIWLITIRLEEKGGGGIIICLVEGYL